MSRLSKSIYYYAEITIEALSPLVLASGKNGIFFDVELIRDANGLPAIPGTTIAGLLRHAIQKAKGKEITKELFGYQEGNAGIASSLETSWAYIHDSKNCFHKSFLLKSEIEKDPILKELYITEKSDFKRDHVCLSDKGVVSGTGKFDRYFVPKGSRFTFSIGLWSDKENENWQEILNLLSHPSFRIGAAGRNGYGKIQVITIKTPPRGYFDLSKMEDIDNFRSATVLAPLIKCEEECISLKLHFPLGFRIGGGSTTYSKDAHKADMLPYSERVIEWNGDVGSFSDKPRIVIPGSALKGALRHRAAFHLARRLKKWDWNIEEDDGLSDLFGYAANNCSEAKGMAGKLWFTDIYLNKSETYLLSRNSIDRFTGGTLNGALFQEENVKGSEVLTTSIYVDKSVDRDSDKYIAFEWALEDLKAGRLALGGGSGHGLGFSYAKEEQ